MEISINIKADEEEVVAIVSGFGSNRKRDVPGDVERLRGILATVEGITAEQITKILMGYITSG
jgi:hypothetical protein